MNEEQIFNLLKAVAEELSLFRNETSRLFDKLENRVKHVEKRFDALEQQVFAIGYELKEDFRTVNEKLDKMSVEVFQARADALQAKIDAAEARKKTSALDELGRRIAALEAEKKAA